MRLALPEKLAANGYGMPINKGFRTSANYTLEDLLKCSIALAHAKAEEITLSCLNCDFFIEAPEICKKANQRPPARVIAFGCPGHENINDEVPF